VCLVVFVATQNGVSMSLIGFGYINANPIWIFGHNLTLVLTDALVKM
jgi:hypothetical protein